MEIDDRYHGNVPNWRDTRTIKAGNLIGVELEVFNDDGREATADALDDFDPGENPMPIAERDGSLCPRRGVELILPPIEYSEAVAEGGYIDRLMRTLRNAGVPEDQPEGYGLHININVRGWAPKTKLLVQYLLNAWVEPAVTLGNRRAGFGTFIPTFSYRRLPGSALLDLQTHSGTKHVAAWLRPFGGGPVGSGDAAVMEVRFPKSCLDVGTVRKVVDYVHAVRDWIDTAPAHTEAVLFLTPATPVALRHFRSWCLKYRPAVAASLGINERELIKTNRLALAVDYTTAVGGPEFTVKGMVNDDPEDQAPRSTKQALRISTLISKGLRLQGEPLAGGWHIAATSVRGSR